MAFERKLHRSASRPAIREALVSFPDPETGEVKKLFTKREVRTAAFDLDGDELDFYDELTRYVEDQSIAAAGDSSARGRAVGFTMALLQRRMASSVYAVRRSLERMRDRREKNLEDPEAYRREQIERRIPDDFDELTEDEQQRIVGQLEAEVLSADPAVLREEIGRLARMIDQAKTLESRETQSKLQKLRTVLTEYGLFRDPKLRLLIFTEHKDTLDYLAADGRDGRTWSAKSSRPICWKSSFAICMPGLPTSIRFKIASCATSILHASARLRKAPSKGSPRKNSICRPS